MNTYSEMEQVCKLLADQTRLEMLTILAHQEVCICELVDYFDISQPAISKHIKKLRDHGLLIEKKQAQWKYYKLNQEYPYFHLIEQVIALCPPSSAKGSACSALEKRGRHQ
ncbi:ArsR/SmtB family transcription factor [Listeria costaricensis]|uniref:ArsR/SmtB family transcription factor n=1 Tax=Listeria costaricensis TaxID=2026604 RepID=UPI000C07FC23|nr:metalloregulator ArsR/SmtB family transcription factor [Listeria costaricensis]